MFDEEVEIFLAGNLLKPKQYHPRSRTALPVDKTATILVRGQQNTVFPNGPFKNIRVGRPVCRLAHAQHIVTLTPQPAYQEGINVFVRL